METLNEKPWEHNCHHGTTFTATRCDFAEGIQVKIRPGTTQEQILADTAEMIGYHATNVLERLNGFQGYGVARFIIEDNSRNDIPASVWELILTSSLSDLYKPIFQKLRDNSNSPLKGSELGRYGLIHAANTALKAMGIHFAIRRTEKSRRRYGDTPYKLYPTD